MLVISEVKNYRAIIKMEYAQYEFCGATRKEAIQKALDWMEIHYVY